MDAKEAKAIGEKYHADLKARIDAQRKKQPVAEKKVALKLEKK